MKTTASLALTTLACLAPCLGSAAEPQKKSAYAERTELAQRSFGNIRFIMGAGSAMPWLEMYSDGRMIAAFQGFSADEVVAAPDGEHFLALSNTLGSTLAFAVLDREGRIIDSAPHGAPLNYCRRTSWGISEWVDAQSPQATFRTEQDQTEPTRDFLAVSVRGCDGRTLLLGRTVMDPDPPRARKPEPAAGMTAADCSAAPVRGDSTGWFTLANVIACLRGFGEPTLTLIDSRRAGATQAAPAK